MEMPNHLVLVRHGESEGNYVRDAFKNGKEGDVAYLLYQFKQRPGHEWRLTPKGVEQARIAGSWIQEHIISHYGLPKFDRYIYSTHRRTYETAGNLMLPDAEWRHNRMLRERSWGELENLTGDKEHEELYPRNYQWMEQSPLEWCPPGGESIVQVADTRVRGVLDTLHRDHDEKDVNSVIAVTHGEWIWAARLVLEYMFNEDWDVTKNNPAEKIHNCQVVHYTRLDPRTGEQAPFLKWMRSVNPYRQETEGNWRELSRRTLSNEEMIRRAEQLPRMISDS
jgi:broad specificity phosphatase PhoE